MIYTRTTVMDLLTAMERAWPYVKWSLFGIIVAFVLWMGIQQVITSEIRFAERRAERRLMALYGVLPSAVDSLRTENARLRKLIRRSERASWK